MFEIQKSKWIWTTEKTPEIPVEMLFRKEMVVLVIPEELTIRITADTRYKLYINGKLVEFGPLKGDKEIWFYDEVNVAPFLITGINCISAEILRFPEPDLEGNQSLIRTKTPGFLIEAISDTVLGREIETGNTWRCFYNKDKNIVPESTFDHRLFVFEEVVGNVEIYGWKQPGFNDSDWKIAKEYTIFDISSTNSPGNMRKRDIPSMMRNESKFAGVSVVRKSESSKRKWNALLRNEEELIIPSDSEEIVEINAGEEMTGFFLMKMAGGAESNIEIIYSECYVQPEKLPGFIPTLPVAVKKDRTDIVNGHLEGFLDKYCVGGFGDYGIAEEFTPFWFRTFRFIQLKIKTKKEPLSILSLGFTETGYPLDVKTTVNTSDKNHSAIWDISVRTLKRCMHETYMDCPYYEQLQYIMDTRAQILYTYTTSADDRLARRAFDDFKRARRSDGLLNCCYPSTTSHIIPGFTVYYIMMLHDHMMYFGDQKLIRDHLATIDDILQYFNRNLNESELVGKVGSEIMDSALPFWSFVDWTEQWNSTGGVPTAIHHGPITMESLLYILGLQKASELCAFCGRSETAKEYMDRANKVQQAVREFCTDIEGCILDGPGVLQYSQHCQVFGVLTGTLDIKNGKKYLQETLINKKKYAQCSVAFTFYLFRALEVTDLYEYTNECWKPWRDMIKQNLTTCVEDTVNTRSDCHAWSALILYELPSVTLGIRPTKPGFSEIEIKPVFGYLSHAEGNVITPKGYIHVKWKMQNGIPDVEIKAPADIVIK